MWRKKKSKAIERNRWAGQFENEEEDGKELAMAAELRALRLATLHTPEDFREALRENLLDQYTRRQLNSAPARPGRDTIFTTRGFRLLVAIWLVSAALVIDFRHTWLAYLANQVGGWIYAPPPHFDQSRPLLTRFLRWVEQIFVAEPWLFPIMRGALLLFGALFAVALILRVVVGIRSRSHPGRVATAYWRSVSAKAMWMSASVAMLLIVVTFSMALNARQNAYMGVGQGQMPRLSQRLESRPLQGNAPMQLGAHSFLTSSRLGMAVGGAMDVGNFRENIKVGYLPQPSDITYEGLYYDYYFDAGEPQPCDQIFCPTYAQARSRNPLTGEMEDFLAVGLASGMAESDFQRKRLDLVVVIDISGSMGETFNRYYYDSQDAPSMDDDEAFTRRKLQVAAEAVIAMLDHLQPEDRLGIVLFSDDATLAQSLQPVGESDRQRLTSQLHALSTAGGTNLASGYRLATELLYEGARTDQAEVESRIIVLTDAQPNTGLTDRDGLAAKTADNAARELYTTIVGIGVDFNSDLIESITKVEGANYYSVHSPAEFVRRLDEGFDYMVTPLVFDLRLEFDSADADIEQVYGSPDADAASGQLMQVKTLFPSDSEDGEVKGGLVLLQLRRNSGADDVASQATLTAVYRDRSGRTFRNETTIPLLPVGEGERYEHTGIRKGVLLARYASLLKRWLAVAGSEPKSGQGEGGALGTWERQSTPLQVSQDYRRTFEQFADHFKQEMDAIGDESLQRELDLLEELAR